jgi:hypothetical protein
MVPPPTIRTSGVDDGVDEADDEEGEDGGVGVWVMNGVPDLESNLGKPLGTPGWRQSRCGFC